MSDPENRLYPGRVVDVTSTARRGRVPLAARINGVLAKFGGRRIGRSNGKPSVFRVDR